MKSTLTLRATSPRSSSVPAAAPRRSAVGIPAPRAPERSSRTYRFALHPALLGVRHRTCHTPGCTRRGYDLWPTLRTCPGCAQPTHPVRRWLR